MRIRSYLKSRSATAPAAPRPLAQTSETTPKTDHPFEHGPTTGTLGYDTRLASSRSSIAPSVRSAQSSCLDDIKHEVMVNYLYQQQCSRLWVSDGSGEMEGVLLRKARNQYLACPPALVDSVFAMVCAQLNVPVRCPATLTRHQV